MAGTTHPGENAEWKFSSDFTAKWALAESSILWLHVAQVHNICILNPAESVLGKDFKLLGIRNINLKKNKRENVEKSEHTRGSNFCLHYFSAHLLTRLWALLLQLLCVARTTVEF